MDCAAVFCWGTVIQDSGFFLVPSIDRHRYLIKKSGNTLKQLVKTRKQLPFNTFRQIT
jgi:hypothetical protein